MSAKARLEARAASAARALLDSIENETPRRDGGVDLRIEGAHLTELRVCLRALDALAMAEAEISP